MTDHIVDFVEAAVHGGLVSDAGTNSSRENLQGPKSPITWMCTNWAIVKKFLTV